MRTAAVDARVFDLETSYPIAGDEHRARIIPILRSNKELIALLQEATPVLESIFGQGLRLSLHVDRDPEDGFEEVFATIRSSHSIETGLRLMAEFDQAWWLSRLPLVKGRLNFVWEPEE